jgi:hypothetical protein
MTKIAVEIPIQENTTFTEVLQRKFGTHHVNKIDTNTPNLNGGKHSYMLAIGTDNAKLD